MIRKLLTLWTCSALVSVLLCLAVDVAFYWYGVETSPRVRSAVAVGVGIVGVLAALLFPLDRVKGGRGS